MKNSREWIESRVSDIERFYPMDTLYDAFEHLPEGFVFKSSLLSVEPSRYSTKIELYGVSKNELMRGNIKIVKYNESNQDDVIIAESEIRYDKDGQITVLNKNFSKEFYPSNQFLFNKFSINRSVLARLSFDKAHYSGNGSYFVKYEILNNELLCRTEFDGFENLKLSIGGNEYDDVNGYYRCIKLFDVKYKIASYTESFSSLNTEEIEDDK